MDLSIIGKKALHYFIEHSYRQDLVPVGGSTYQLVLENDNFNHYLVFEEPGWKRFYFNCVDCKIHRPQWSWISLTTEEEFNTLLGIKKEVPIVGEVREIDMVLVKLG